MDNYIEESRRFRELELARERTLKRRRNILVAICALLLSVVVFFTFDEGWISKGNAVLAATQSSTQEPLKPVNSSYVASRKSNKYHKKTCQYADSIYWGNKVYYKTEEEAERDGKYPCSVCNP